MHDSPHVSCGDGPIATLVASILLLLLLPAESYAWGAGMHLQVGSFILENASILKPWLGAILTAHPYDFLYGCVAADITLGKKYTHYLEHCHNWRIGLKILNRADDDRLKACAYGYLSHLAADTIAHSYYVPYKMIRTFNTRMLNHAYWEMRFEGDIPDRVWNLAGELAKRDFRSNDALMRSVLSDTLFSFSTNKRLFNSVMFLSRLKQWRKVLNSMDKRSRWEIDTVDRSEYLTLSTQAAYSLLLMEESSVWKADPKGERAFAVANMVRRNLRFLWQEGKLSKDQAETIISQMKERLRQSITEPESLLDLLSQS